MKRTHAVCAGTVAVFQSNGITRLWNWFKGRACFASMLLAFSLSAGVDSAKAASITTSVQSCTPSVLDCAQTGAHNASAFTAIVSVSNLQTLKISVAQLSSTLTIDTIFSNLGGQFGDSYKTFFGDQIAFVFGGPGAVGMFLAEVNRLDFGPAGRVGFDAVFHTPNLAAPLAVDVYYAAAAVPEPETYALLLAGLVMIAAIARRRMEGAHGRVRRDESAR